MALMEFKHLLIFLNQNGCHLSNQQTHIDTQLNIDMNLESYRLRYEHKEIYMKIHKSCESNSFIIFQLCLCLQTKHNPKIERYPVLGNSYLWQYLPHCPREWVSVVISNTTVVKAGLNLDLAQVHTIGLLRLN